MALLLTLFISVNLVMILQRRRIFPPVGRWASWLCLTLALGSLVCSQLLWLGMLITGKSAGDLALTFDFGLLLLLLALEGGLLRKLAKPQPVSIPDAAADSRWWNALPLLAGGACVTLALGWLRLYPEGAWDALGIWNLRALFLSQEAWTASFDAALASSHLDYPLGHPMMIARLMSYEPGLIYFASDHFNVSFYARLVSMQWLMVLLLGMWSMVASLRGRWLACLALLTLLTLPLLCQQVSHLYADLPLAAVMLLGAGSLAMALETRRLLWFTLAGFFIATAAWTKNEGLAFALASSAALMGYAILTRLRSWKHLAALAAGALLPLACLIGFKMMVPLSNDLIQTSQAGSMLGRIFSPLRHGQVIRTLAAELSIWDVLPCLAPILWMACHKPSRLGLMLASLTGLYIVQLYLAYVITPHDLGWHVSTSVTRLLLQCWPVLILTAALWGRPLTPVAPARQADSSDTSAHP
jgi:hypothetical protein